MVHPSGVVCVVSFRLAGIPGGAHCNLHGGLVDLPAVLYQAACDKNQRRHAKHYYMYYSAGSSARWMLNFSFESVVADYKSHVAKVMNHMLL